MEAAAPIQIKNRKEASRITICSLVVVVQEAIRMTNKSALEENKTKKKNDIQIDKYEEAAPNESPVQATISRTKDKIRT